MCIPSRAKLRAMPPTSVSRHVSQLWPSIGCHTFMAPTAAPTARMHSTTDQESRCRACAARGVDSDRAWRSGGAAVVPAIITSLRPVGAAGAGRRLVAGMRAKRVTRWTHISRPVQPAMEPANALSKATWPRSSCAVTPQGEATTHHPHAYPDGSRQAPLDRGMSLSVVAVSCYILASVLPEGDHSRNISCP